MAPSSAIGPRRPLDESGLGSFCQTGLGSACRRDRLVDREFAHLALASPRRIQLADGRFAPGQCPTLISVKPPEFYRRFSDRDCLRERQVHRRKAPPQGVHPALYFASAKLLDCLQLESGIGGGFCVHTLEIARLAPDKNVDDRTGAGQPVLIPRRGESVAASVLR